MKYIFMIELLMWLAKDFTSSALKLLHESCDDHDECMKTLICRLGSCQVSYPQKTKEGVYKCSHDRDCWGFNFCNNDGYCENDRGEGDRCTRDRECGIFAGCCDSEHCIRRQTTTPRNKCVDDKDCVNNTYHYCTPTLKGRLCRPTPRYAHEFLGKKCNQQDNDDNNDAYTRVYCNDKNRWQGKKGSKKPCKYNFECYGYCKKNTTCSKWKQYGEPCDNDYECTLGLEYVGTVGKRLICIGQWDDGYCGEYSAEHERCSNSVWMRKPCYPGLYCVDESNGYYGCCLQHETGTCREDKEKRKMRYVKSQIALKNRKADGPAFLKFFKSL